MKKFFAVGLRLSCLAAVALSCGYFSDNLAAAGSESVLLNNGAPGAPAKPLSDDLIAQIISLKNSVTAATSPEEISNIMGKIDDLERQLAVLQGVIPPPINSLPSSPPDPSLPADPAQADLIQKIISLKNAMTATTSPEEQGVIMRQIDDLNQQLSLLQAASPPPTDPVPPKPEPPPSDPKQTELIEQIIGLKNQMTATIAPEEQAAIMQKIDILTQQLVLVQNSTPPQPASNATLPTKTEAGPTPNSAPAAATGSANNKLWIVNNSRPVSAKPQGNLVTVTWNGGPGIRLQMSTTIGNAGWQDVPNTDGQSSVDLPMSNTGTFFRVIKR
jgi:hypothetical protein